MQRKIPNRIVILAKDIMNITGRKERASRDLLKKIKDHYHKSTHQFVTLSEFCTYTGLPEEDVKSFLL